VVTQKTARKRKAPRNSGARTRTLNDEKEASVLKKVLETLSLCGGVEVVRNNTGRRGRVRFGLGKGSPDIVAAVAPYGRWLCIETKRPKGGEVSIDQLKWLDRWARVGAVVAVVTDPEEVFALVERARGATVQ
jgi:hypothetical protein